MSEQLKPCPFCGSEAKVSQFKDLYAPLRVDAAWYVTCTKCGCLLSGGYLKQEEAIQAWNKRASNCKHEITEALLSMPPKYKCNKCGQYIDMADNSGGGE